MDAILILLFLIGVGALGLGVAARRAAEELPAPRPVRPPSRGTGENRTAAPPERPGRRELPAPASAPEPVREPEPAPEPEPAFEPPGEIRDPAPAERRKHPRIRSDQTFTVTPFAGRAVMAQCCDLSAGGMRFGIVGCTLRVGDLVRVTFNVGAETVGAIGSVLRIKELDPITSEVSLEFVRLDPWATQLIEQALQDGA
jgi:hypothetical protein